MKIWAKVKFRNSRNAECLIQAFFKEFNSDSSISIRGRQAIIELISEKPCIATIRAISCCEVLKFDYGKKWEDYEEDNSGEAEEEQFQQMFYSLEPEEEEPYEEPEPAEPEQEEESQEEPEPAESEQEEEPREEPESAEPEQEEEPREEHEPAEPEQEEEPYEESEPAETEQEEEPYEESEPAETEQEEESREEPEPAESEQKEKSHEEPKQQKKRKGRPKVVGPETVNIPCLREMAGKATSFEHFAKLVAEWLEMGKYQAFFENLVIAASQVPNMSWKELKKALKYNGVSYTESIKIKTVKYVSERIEKYDTTLLPFLGAIALYKNHSFGNEESEPAETEQEKEAREEPETVYDEEEPHEDLEPDEVAKEKEPHEESQSDGTEKEEPRKEPTPIKERMECMPEIFSFEKALGSVDRTQPIEERVKHVLTAMGWDKKAGKEKELIFVITNAAIRVKVMSFDNIFKKANIPVQENMSARMELSKLINDFVRMHYPTHKVKVLDFLKELQEIVMLESEIENLAD